MTANAAPRRSAGRLTGLSGLLGAALLLAACVGQTPPQTSKASVTTATPAKLTEVEPPAAPTVDPPAPPPAPPADPAQLIGMGSDGLAMLLGQPALKRAEPPAQVWLYPARACVFHVYLYAPKGGGAYRVTHYEAVPRRLGDSVDPDCFAGLLTRVAGNQTAG
ncbi:MAG TPA: hypothetical protein VE631_04970 [Alphaproteobacteria bacterium]|nr:hypothetical protein [Alphaproteobacteria bacterium]